MKLFRSFYGRLSLIFLLLISLLGAGCIAIAFYFSGHLFDEVEQVLNRGYAQSIAAEMQPLVREGLSGEKLGGIIHSIMVLNPMVEIYLLGGDGGILSYFTHPGESIVRTSVDLTPISEFIDEKGTRLILGDDPRSAIRRKPFSAAPLAIGSAKGYVYIILGGQEYDRSLYAIRSGYYAQTALIAFIFVLLATLAAGFLIFFLLTGRLRGLDSAIRSFKQGRPFRPVPVKGQDELSSLGRTFNDMATSIAEGIVQRKELIANISHDLRSPLASIRGYLETLMMREGQLDPVRRKEFLEIILRNVTGFQSLVEELFELVMLETRQVEPVREPVNLGELAQDVTLKLKPLADAAGVALSLVAGAGIPLIPADIGMIERVLTNLLENAIRFAPAESAVSVILSAGKDSVSVSVRDAGPGIPESEIPRIFDRYFHGKRDNSRTSGKTGLGLAIARQMAEIHGGALTVESSPGKGSCFTLNLPVLP